MSLRSRYLFAGILVAVAAGCGWLGVWQWGRLKEQRAANAAAAAGRERPIVALGAGRKATVGSLNQRRVSVKGRFDRRHELLIRGQVYRDVPGVHVITPLRPVEGDTAILVNRGFVPAPDAVSAEVDSLDEPGLVSVDGVALPIGTRRDRGSPLNRSGRTTWRALDLSAVRARLPYPIFDAIILRAPVDSGPRSPRRLLPPPLDDGPHLSYALQWFAFAGMALVFAGVILTQGRWSGLGPSQSVRTAGGQ